MANFPPEFFKIPPGVIFLLIVWSLFWKGVALWQAARNGQKNWFITLLVFNTLGILEILYLRFFQKKAKANRR